MLSGAVCWCAGGCGLGAGAVWRCRAQFLAEDCGIQVVSVATLNDLITYASSQGRSIHRQHPTPSPLCHTRSPLLFGEVVCVSPHGQSPQDLPTVLCRFPAAHCDLDGDPPRCTGGMEEQLVQIKEYRAKYGAQSCK